MPDCVSSGAPGAPQWEEGFSTSEIWAWVPLAFRAVLTCTTRVVLKLLMMFALDIKMDIEHLLSSERPLGMPLAWWRIPRAVEKQVSRVLAGMILGILVPHSGHPFTWAVLPYLLACCVCKPAGIGV